MKVINSVGYDNQNLSHFRSSDIWSSASDPDVSDPSGWLGRFIASENPNFLTTPPERPPAIQIGDTGNSIFNDQELISIIRSIFEPLGALGKDFFSLIRASDII